jgi:hypothetical protein
MGLVGYARSAAIAGHSVHVNTKPHANLVARIILVNSLGAGALRLSMETHTAGM